MENKNYNTVNVVVPVAGEYILTINEHMLIVKCIDDKMKQYSEFVKVNDNYIMRSVNFRSGNIIRVMEEFCKTHNCPKILLMDAMSIAQKDYDTKQHNLYKEDINKLMEENNLLKSRIIELEDTVSRYRAVLIIAKDALDNVQDNLDNMQVIKKDEATNNSNISYDSDKDNSKSFKKKSSNSFIKKSDKAVTNTVRVGSKPGSIKKEYNKRITKDDGDVILELWKTMRAIDIAEKFPEYNAHQICNYCSRKSDFNKVGLTKEFINELKSYNGEKTLKELGKIYGKVPSVLKRICEKYNISYKENI